MVELSVRNLEDLVVATTDDPATHVQKIYDWDHQRQMSIGTWSLGVSASLFVGLLLAAITASSLKSDNKQPLEIIGLAFGAFALVCGGLQLRRIGGTYSKYIGALSLLARLRDIRPFLVRYRSDPAARPWI